MTEEMKFFMYLTEYYADFKHMKTGDVLRSWEQKGIIERIYNNYWVYHTECIENAYMDIDSLMEKGESAW